MTTPTTLVDLFNQLDVALSAVTDARAALSATTVSVQTSLAAANGKHADDTAAAKAAYDKAVADSDAALKAATDQLNARVDSAASTYNAALAVATQLQQEFKDRTEGVLGDQSRVRVS